MLEMPWRLTAEDFTSQTGLTLLVSLAVADVSPAYAVPGEILWPLAIAGGAGAGDSIKLMPRKQACATLYDLPADDPRYGACACAGAAASDQGGQLVDGLVILPKGISSIGPHVVCHAFSPTINLDGLYAPQRGVTFHGVSRGNMVPILQPNATKVDFRTAFTFASPYDGYVRFTLASDGVGDAGEDPCADAHSLVSTAIGGALVPPRGGFCRDFI